MKDDFPLLKKWLKIKKGGEIKFTLGSIGLEKPYDRRYFTAKNSEGKLLGFVVFIPYANKSDYLTDFFYIQKFVWYN